MIEKPVAVITGSSRGLGRALVAHFLSLGLEVHGCSRQTFEGIPGYTHHVCDVADEGSVRRLVDSVRRSAGRLDVLVNNAGIGLAALALTTTTRDAESVLRTNLLGTMTMCREGAKLMMKRRYGRIVNISSVAVSLRMEGASAYSAAKAGVEQYTRVLAREVASLGITVNVVAPSLVETDMMASLSPAARAKYLEGLTIKRAATQEEFCNVVEFLTRKESGILTGQVIQMGLAS